MRRRRLIGGTAVAASAAVNLLLFIVLAWAQSAPAARPRPEPLVVRDLLAAAPPPEDRLERSEPPAVVAEEAPAAPDLEPMEPAAPAERFDARVPLPSADLRLPPAAASAPAAREGPPAALGRVDRPPRRTLAPLPPYPDWARQRRLEAVVHLRLVVGANGCVCDVQVERVDGDPRFGDAAREAVRAWTFEPAVRDGRPVDCVLLQRVRFEMTDR